MLISKTRKFSIRLCQIAKFICREGPEGDGAEKADLEARFAQPLDGPLGDPGGRPVGDEDQFRIIRLVELMTRFLLGDDLVLPVQLPVVLLHLQGVEDQPPDDLALARSRRLS